VFSVQPVRKVLSVLIYLRTRKEEKCFKINGGTRKYMDIVIFYKVETRSVAKVGQGKSYSGK
jgi:hypothetical protein